MSKRKESSPTRSFRPMANSLETRQMLSGVVTGTDIDGDTWTLRLTGPGSISVLKQPDANGDPNPLNSQTEINSIEVAGTNPLTSVLTGTVTKGANGDGQVFFQNFAELPSHSAQFSGLGLGLLAINMPGFYLGNTTPASSVTTSNPSTPSMTIPDGTDTLNFGGVDMTHDQYTPVAGTSGSVPTSINAVVQLGLPLYGGTRVIINKSVSTHQSVTASGSTTPTVVQEGVVFAASGRVDLFQANEIDGDAALPPAQFSDISSTAAGTGGTVLIDTQPGGVGGGGYLATENFFTAQEIRGALGGQIGDVRIGGNATNFTTLVADPETESIDRISNFSVGGETNNVMVVAPNGLRNAVFGKGLDNTEIYTHVINTLKANRDTLNSNVYVDRTISSVTVGGDSDTTTVETGITQNYSTIFSNILGATTGTPSSPGTPVSTQPFGGMEVHIAGDVNNSVYSASVAPYQNVFGSSNDLTLPGGKISGKVEGTIDNSIATPDNPTKTFYAQQVTRYNGPVVPPTVPEAPYNEAKQPTHAPGVSNLDKVPTVTVKTPTATVTKSKAASVKSTPKTTVGVTTPKGPSTTTN